jgi:Zn-dependent protease with chaperone function
MTDALVRFVVFNLGASLVAGSLVAAVALGVSGILGIRDARVRSWLLGAALIKATLVLAGLGTLLVNPPGLADALGGGALAPSAIAPFILVWAGTVLMLRSRIIRSLQLDGGRARLDESAADRLAGSVERVASAARTIERSDGPRFRCTLPADLPTPAARLSQARGPATVDPEGQPVIEVPSELIGALDDAELDAVVAHEVGHVVIARDREGCAPLWARVARWTSPAAALIGPLLDREEELACDELAVRVTGQPTALASALLKAHRLQRSASPILAPVGQLLGRSGLLKSRVERLAVTEPMSAVPSMQRVAAACGTTLLATLVL